MNDFKPVIEGRKVIQPAKVRKQTSVKLMRINSLNSSFKVEPKSFPVALPVARRLSIKSNQGLKQRSEKNLISMNRTAYSAFEDTPTLPKKTFHNERIFWKKRSLGNLPLLLIIFEGTIGDYYKSNWWIDEKPSFVLREDISSNINRLKKEFYIVLISTYSRYPTKELVNLFNKTIVDAIYIQRHRKWHERHIHDVNSILEDFAVSDKSKVIALCAIGIEAAEIRGREGQELIFENSLSDNKKNLCYYVPTCHGDVPVTVLVPHIRLLNRVPLFYDIADFLIRLKKLENDFFKGFEKYFTGQKLKIELKGSYLETSLHRLIFHTGESHLIASASEYKIRLRKTSDKYTNSIQK